MAWEKRGWIFGPANGAPWMRSHAQIPTVLDLGERLRIFFSSRPEPGLSMTGYVDVDAKDPTKVLGFTDRPIVPRGGPGAFDEFGVMPSSVHRVGDEVWLYSIGWQRGQTVPYLNAIGLLVSRDGGETFERPFVGPVLDRTPGEPYSTMSPCVLREGDAWHMWYGSGVDWIRIGEKFEPIYLIKYARSQDGLTWTRPNILCVPGATPDEANTRPTVVNDGGAYRMWFSYRGSHDFRGGADAYRMGYSTSPDGLTWTRDDAAAGIGPGAPDAWDGEMVAYPNVIDTAYGRYMFYNGSGFGAAGFGYAVWRD
jgi:hypothetical protein